MIEKNVKLMVARVKKGLKQFELSRDIDVHATEYSQYENSRRIPKKEIQVKIAARLGVKVEDIFDNIS